MKCKNCGEESGTHKFCNECYSKNQKMSEGEEVIKEFLDEEDIRYEFQKIVKDLKGDKKEFRIADFFLPKYKVYLEFFGNWNTSDKQKERYREKKRIFKENKIPCVYLYPENLGILDRILRRRIKKALQSHKELRMRLFLINWDIFAQKFGIIGILLVILIFYVKELTWKGLFSLAFLGQIYVCLKESFFRTIE